MNIPRSVSFLLLLAFLNLGSIYCDATCGLGKTYDVANEVCITCDDQETCVECLPESTDICMECISGHFHNNGYCGMPCQVTNCDVCPTYTTCSQCKQGYGSDGTSSCVACAIGCSECDGGTGECTACLNNYELDDGECILPCNAANCETCEVGSSSTCAACSEDYFLSSGKCQEITPSSDIELQSTIRYEMTMTDYDNEGGNAFFIEGVSSILEIDQSQMSIISVKQGSVIIKYKIKASGTGNKQDELKAIKTRLDAAVASGDMKFNGVYTILDYSSGFVTVAVTASCPSGQSPDSNGICVKDSKANVGAILGGVLGGTALLIVLILIAYKKGWLARLSTTTKSPQSGSKYDLAKSNPTSPDAQGVKTENAA